MHSKPILLLLGTCVLLAAGNCTSKDERIKDVCSALEQCTQYFYRSDRKDCQDELDDALEDGRITPTDITRCSRCAHRHLEQHNDGKPGCENLLTERDCDVACKQISFVLEAQTTQSVRDQVCDTLTRACGEPRALDALCSKEFEQGYRDRVSFEARLALDVEVRRCGDCIAPAANVFVDAGAPDAGDAGITAADLNGCSQILERCAEPCSGVKHMTDRLTLARSMFTYCDSVQACPFAPEAQPPPATLRQDCFSALSGLEEDDSLRACAACAEAGRTCSSIQQNCADCARFQVAESLGEGTCPGCGNLQDRLPYADAIVTLCGEALNRAAALNAGAAGALTFGECANDLLSRIDERDSWSCCGTCLEGDGACDGDAGSCNCELPLTHVAQAHAQRFACNRLADCPTLDAGPSLPAVLLPSCLTLDLTTNGARFVECAPCLARATCDSWLQTCSQCDFMRGASQ
jgi:hypothetical protein